jgi:hypothetical protein
MRIAGENVMTRLLASCLVALAIPAFLPGSDEEDDPSKWTPVKIAADQPAPEFEDITAWVNSKPLTMKGLKGKVVVVHFMAFG